MTDEYAAHKLKRILRWRGEVPRNTHELTKRFARACMPELMRPPILNTG